jgi:hypothetical protein
MAYKSKPTVTRPANTTAYTAGDVVGGAIEFADIGPYAGDILITTASLRINIAAIPSGMTSFTLHLYDITPPSALADNAAWDLPAGDRNNYLGQINLGSPADLGSTLRVQTDQVNTQVRLGGSYSVWGYLVTNGGFTPAGNSEVYVPTLHAVSLPNER